MLRPSADQLHFAAPARPFFVVTTITPFAAFVPYSVAADGPFTISMSSISSGLRLLRRLIGVEPAEFAPCAVIYRTPSTTQIGALLRLIDETPRTRMVGAAPSAEPERTLTPGAFATSRSCIDMIGVVSTR